MSRTLFDKLWDAHVVRPETEDAPALIYIDLHLIHEVTSPQAFAELAARGLKVRRPDRTVATMDHSTPTWPADLQGQRRYGSEQAWEQVQTLLENCDRHGITVHDWDSPNRGIVHVMGPELGLSRPGMTIVCGDSHTSTHGAFGALAFGIGTSEVGHVLATQCLLQRKPKTMRITVDGRLGTGVSAKDLVLHVIGQVGVDAGTGHVIEFAGSAIRALDMEGRMTVCNMAIEAGARAGLIAPDQTTVDWLRGRAHCPQGEDFERAADAWLQLQSDSDARFDKEFHFDADEIQPTITYGTHPGMVVGIAQPVPATTNPANQRAMEYMQVTPGKPLIGRKVDVVFVGSCTNARLGDLRAAAEIMRGRRVAEGVRMLVVPGSEQVRKAAEAEGLDDVFLAAGAEWREPGCSMCIAMNGDQVAPGQTAVSTSNRNFEGRQGPGSRTFLASPATAAACAVKGCITDPRHIDAAPEVRIHFPSPRHMEARQ
ncbi:3-isopropylmalate dehydratase large subunit [Wenzhouxiangella sp. AB-CW3]|uniref:3-isopropylmalate dehydratase large subunit n=1 Tax=Wenzhouxiangella sp. AB-CW3 TaxID=2771012 RepID=UPI00168B6549|nr:3-isopropylmalate dehydratase large subunit [Wenzhouxiangella sp. AB-CW3]QOC22067.1 3-isopropylmalate dehydratase large subunit [Wenzhouxiangella sp. AB-CW3]